MLSPSYPQPLLCHCAVMAMLVQVLYYMADNRLSGKLETAIQALDNITKTYYRFVNAEPLARTSPATPARRYDAHLVPYDVLERAEPALRSCYDGISENVAGVIEDILALKAIIKDVYDENTVNQSTFEQTCHSFVFRTQQVRQRRSPGQQFGSGRVTGQWTCSLTRFVSFSRCI